MSESAITNVAEFKQAYKNCIWRIEWNNKPYVEDGFIVVTQDPRHPNDITQIAFCNTFLQAEIVRDALNSWH